MRLNHWTILTGELSDARGGILNVVHNNRVTRQACEGQAEKIIPLQRSEESCANLNECRVVARSGSRA